MAAPIPPAEQPVTRTDLRDMVNDNNYGDNFDDEMVFMIILCAGVLRSEQKTAELLDFISTRSPRVPERHLLVF